MFRNCIIPGLTALGILLLPATAAAQDSGPGTGGLARLAQEERAIQSPYRVLVIGAHPDDEDTELITILSRGMGVETAYLSLTRGEGGQNLIGSELGEALGIVRSEELRAARRVDGGHQFFTRAFDFGFSKTADETFSEWPRDSLIKDAVRVIRRFRPHVIVSVFSGTPRDGHGHHQVAGQVALAAFRAAGDPNAFAELAHESALAPWTPAKFYRDYGSTGGIVLDGGVLDPATGQSLHQIAMRSRSRHRSQDMGRLEEPGPSQASIALEELAPGIEAEPLDSLFHGIDAGPDRFDSTHTQNARLITAGIITDAYIDDAEVTPGQRVALNIIAWNAGTEPVEAEFNWPRRAGWQQLSDSACGRVSLAAGQLHHCVVWLQVSEDARPDQPYYLERERNGSMYDWSGAAVERGEPYEAPLGSIVTVRFPDGSSAMAEREVTARSLDQGLGEVRQPVTIVPGLLVDVNPGSLLWPSTVPTRTFTVTVEQAAPEAVNAIVELGTPTGWQVTPPQQVTFSREGERHSLEFVVTAPQDPVSGPVQFMARAIVGTDTFSTAIERIEYPHLRARSLFSPATVGAVVADVELPRDLAIGYVRGAADGIPEALAAAGVTVQLLGPRELQGAALDQFDVIVIGPRAYEIDDALQRAHPRLLQFTRNGGTLIVQYQQYQFVRGGFAPHPLTIARPHHRVTDQSAEVSLLDPDAAALTSPNRIGPGDFEGWIQERGLYFAATWDSAWTPLMRMGDPGEPERDGSMLIASLGEGTVVYTGVAFFRQLPAAVPGAWRLFANLLALGGD